jgi:hypothetical protein
MTANPKAVAGRKPLDPNLHSLARDDVFVARKISVEFCRLLDRACIETDA